MNWGQAEGKWKQYIGKFKEKWARLADDDRIRRVTPPFPVDDLNVIDGQRQQLLGRVQERQADARELTKKQVEEFLHALEEANAPEEQKAQRASVG